MYDWKYEVYASIMNHRIYVAHDGTSFVRYGYAKHRDGTDVWFDSYEECKQDIIELEKEKVQKNKKLKETLQRIQNKDVNWSEVDNKIVKKYCGYIKYLID